MAEPTKLIDKCCACGRPVKVKRDTLGRLYWRCMLRDGGCDTNAVLGLGPSAERDTERQPAPAPEPKPKPKETPDDDGPKPGGAAARRPEPQREPEQPRKRSLFSGRRLFG